MYAWIVVVIVGCGVLGGLLSRTWLSSAQRKKTPLWGSVLRGLAGAALVPLFLSMISSALIDQILGTGGKTADPSKLFLLIGFCLLAAISSRGFIDMMTQKLLKQADNASEKADTAAAMVSDVEKKADGAVRVVQQLSEPDAAPASSGVVPAPAPAFVTAAEAAPPIEVAPAGFTLAPELLAAEEAVIEREVPSGAPILDMAEPEPPGITVAPAMDALSTEAAVLRAMKNSSYPMRAVSGVAYQTGLDHDAAAGVLSELAGKGLVAETHDLVGAKRWLLTTPGRAAADE